MKVSLLIAATVLTVAACKTTQEDSETKGIFNKKSKVANETKKRVYTDPQKEKIILAFAGKGTALAWDTGVLNVLYKRVKGIRDNNVVLTGSSSGAIWATYFACYGINPDSIARMNELVKRFDKKLVNDGGGKTPYVLSGQEYKMNYPHSNLDEFIKLGLRNMDCKPKLPTVIAAANADVLARQFRKTFKIETLEPVRNYMPEFITDADNQIINSPLGNRDVLRAQKDANYDVRSTTGKFLGKSCTYFVDPIMFKELKLLDPHNRKCDLRLMEDAEDMKDAILASVSEPTYFDWWRDRKPHKIEAMIQNPNDKRGEGVVKKGLTHRHYNGGYPMTIVTEDVKRVYPTAYTISTGRFPLTKVQNGFVKHWYTSDGNKGMFHGLWWVDADFVPTEAFWAASELKQWSAEKEIKEGEKAAEKMLSAAQDARPNPMWMVPPVDKTVYYRNRKLDMTLYRDRGIRSILDRRQ